LGKQFPATWKVQAGYHVPGTEIVGQTSNLAERIINIDDLLIASAFIAVIDEAKAHYEVRSEYAKQCGLALSYQWDKNVLQVGALAARASATISGADGGTQLTSSTTLYRTSAVDRLRAFTPLRRPSTRRTYLKGKPSMASFAPLSTTCLRSPPT
jgi:hypothetical protein